MSKENLINDFILEATQEAPSQEKVNAIVNQYDNDDDLINDLYVHYKGEAPDAERLNVVKNQYLSTTETPVKKKKKHKRLFLKRMLRFQIPVERKLLLYRTL